MKFRNSLSSNSETTKKLTISQYPTIAVPNFDINVKRGQILESMVVGRSFTIFIHLNDMNEAEHGVGPKSVRTICSLARGCLMRTRSDPS